MNITRVLALLPLFVGLAHSFSWDIVASDETRLTFYHNGTVTHNEKIPMATISSVTYDPVHYRLFYADRYRRNTSIVSFDIATRAKQPIVTAIEDDFITSLAYDPVTQLLFWQQGDHRIYSLSLPLKPASSNKTNNSNLIVTLEHGCVDIAVDSSGGFIYWITKYEIERAAFDGSKREVLVGVTSGRSLAIDQQEQKMYWIDEISLNQHSIESADLNGKNRRTFYLIGTEYWAGSLAISKDFIFWRSSSIRSILQVKKSQPGGEEPIVYLQYNTYCPSCHITAANYTIKEQTLGIKSCEALKNVTVDVEERNRSICQNFCFEGNCSISAEGHPKCRCNAGYSGHRCEVDRCRGYCLNNGVCSLHEEADPVCRCSADYEGDRCEFPAVLIKCIQTVSMLRDMLSADTSPVSLGKGVKSTCASTVV